MNEDREIYVALVLVALIPEAGTLARGGATGAGMTLCLMMSALGIFGLVSGAWRARRSRLPAARVVERPGAPQTR